MDFSEQINEALENLDQEKVKSLVESEDSDNGVLTVDMISRALDMDQEDVAILILMAVFKHYDLTDDSWEQLIYQAARRGHNNFLKMLITLDNGHLSVAERVVQELNLGRSASSGRPSKPQASPLHECVTNAEHPALVFLFALMGAPVNIQNKAGDSALHLAVLDAKCEMVEALLQCGVNPMLRNKLGQTAAEIAQRAGNSSLADLIRSYEPGLAWGLDCSDRSQGARAVVHALRRWVSPHSVLEASPGGRTGIALARDRGMEKSLAPSSLVSSLLLAHRVLADDVRGIRVMLSDPGASNSLRLRHADSGMTPLAAAVRNHNRLVMHELLTHGATVNIRVYNTPLVIKAMEWNAPFTIIQELLAANEEQAGLDSTIWRERDCHGNTLILHALKNGCSAREMETLLSMSPGRSCLAHRTSQSLQNARELAMELDRPDLVVTIDNAVGKLFAGVGRSTAARTALMSLAIAYYGAENFAAAAHDRMEDPNVRGFLSGLAAIEEGGVALMRAVEDNDYVAVKNLNQADYIDKNGFTALTRAIVLDREDIVRWLVAERPQLRFLSDNDGRYPLHYAYALPQDIGDRYVGILLARDSAAIEELSDKDGRIPCDYRRMDEESRNSILTKVTEMDVYGSPK